MRTCARNEEPGAGAGGAGIMPVCIEPTVRPEGGTVVPGRFVSGFFGASGFRDASGRRGAFVASSIGGGGSVR